jgi:ubiquinone/menaquinone biosynthesis C-methylase UbiE
MPSLLRTSYQKIFPPTVRAKMWRLRHKLRSLPTESRNLQRHLSFRMSGRCTVCHSRHLTIYSNQAIAQLPFRFYSCQDCGFIFVLAPADLASEYDAHAIPDFGEGEELWNQHYLDCINGYAKVPGKLLEIGFGTGSFLKLAHDNGWEVYGTDLSEPLVRHAREDLKLPNISRGMLEELAFPDDSFDVVAGFNFLEHVPDARKILEEIKRILRPSGVLAIMCPNISGIYHTLMPEILADNDPLKISWVPPQHIGYFNKTNLRMLLESVGFVDLEDASHAMSTLWRQFEPEMGQRATDRKLATLMADIQASPLPRGDERVAEYKQQIKRLIVERMTWTMLVDFMKLEPLLGAEVGVLFLGRKADR